MEIYEAYMRWLDWRFNDGNNSMLRNIKAIEQAEKEFWRFWHEARKQERAVVKRPPTIRDTLPKRKTSTPSPKRFKQPDPPRKRIKKLADYFDDEAEEDKRPEKEIDEDGDGNLEDFVVSDGDD